MVVTEMVKLPANGIVQGVGPGVAPMTVQVVLAHRGRAAADIEDQLRAAQRRLDGEELGLGHVDGRSDQQVSRITGGVGPIDGGRGA